MWGGVGVDARDDRFVLGSCAEVVLDLLFHVVVSVVFGVGFVGREVRWPTKLFRVLFCFGRP